MLRRQRNRHWYLGGHSLGGVTAAGLVTQGETADETSDWDGIVLLAAYPNAPITVPAILIYGTNDGIVEPEEYGRIVEDGLWPEDFTEVRLEGGNHAQFGDYGEQNGDNKAEMSFDEQLDQTADAITEWIEARR